MRQCSKCGEMKPEDEFYNWKHEHQCKECKKEKDKNYHQEHREERNENSKKYYQEHKEESIKYSKVRYQIHKEEMDKKSKAWYQEHKDEIRQKAGKTSMYENKMCSNYLGVVVGEYLCRYLFKDVEVMPNNNPGFDFICNRNKKIDVKTGCTRKDKYISWSFHIDRNTIPDFFILVAFDNRTDLNPIHLWMIPGHEINKNSGKSISQSTLHKWDNYKKDIKDAQICCAELKEANHND